LAVNFTAIGDRVIEVVELGAPNDRCGSDRLCQEPDKRHLGARDATRIADFGHARRQMRRIRIAGLAIKSAIAAFG
jgi:hypothetical protein